MARTIEGAVLSLSPQIEARLKAQSRSFYWALKLLPSRLQQPLVLTYLAAREADDIIDDTRRSLADRLTQLKGMQEDLERAQPKNELLLAIRQSPGSHHMTQLLQTLLSGMEMDLTRVEAQSPLSKDECAIYIDKIAACVGVAWTELALEMSPELYVADPRPFALPFGRALQRVNILRDIRADHLRQRYYLGIGSEQLTQPDAWLRIRSQLLPFMKQAYLELESAARYIRCVDPGQKQYAMALFSPAVLAGETLDLIRKKDPLKETIKISRNEVYLWLMKAFRLDKELIAFEARIGERIRLWPN
jgi:phytoene/squalene synthetase